MRSLGGWSAAAVAAIVSCASPRVDGSSARCTSASVPDVPPDTTPAWFGDDSSWTRSGFRYLKHTIAVSFQPGTTPTQRRQAMTQICGTVVGGWRAGLPGRGIYAVRVDDGDDADRIWKLIEQLRRLPQVRSAAVDPLMSVNHATGSRVVPAAAPDSVPAWVRADSSPRSRPHS
jgi:hypothetical protein